MKSIDGQDYLTAPEAKTLLNVPYLTFSKIVAQNDIQPRIEIEDGTEVAYYLKSAIEGLVGVDPPLH